MEQKGGDILLPSPSTTPISDKNYFLLKESRPYIDDKNSHIEIDLRISCVPDGVTLFDMNDSSGRYLTMLYIDTRSIWIPLSVQLMDDEENTMYNGIQFSHSNWVTHELYHLNTMLFESSLYTPQNIYSLPGFDLKDLMFRMQMIAPSYSTWVHMQNVYGLVFKTEGDIIPLTYMRPIYLKLNFHSLRWYFNSPREALIYNGIDPNFFLGQL